MYRLQKRCAGLVFSHDTALDLHGLSDRPPSAFAITVAQGTNVHHLSDIQIKAFYCKPELLGLGMEIRETRFGNPVRVYDAARSVCDAIRCRKRMDNSIVIDALRRYVEDKRDINLLLSYAERFHMRKTMTQYVEVLV